MNEALEEAEKEHLQARDVIATYIRKTSDRRIKLVSDGPIRHILTVLSAEMSLAGALGQIDIVLELGRMAEDLSHSDATLAIRENEDYRRRFGEDLHDSLDILLRS
jgi:signal transduction histidine kinase